MVYTSSTLTNMCVPADSKPVTLEACANNTTHQKKSSAHS